MKPRFGQKINLTIQRLGINGEGVGYWHGYTVFVDGALPGEVVHARLSEQRKSFGRARVTERLSTSVHRVDPPCPLFGACGGCQIMHLNDEQQLEMKRQRVVDALTRIGKFQDLEVLPCIPSPSPLAYRNKIQLPVVAGESSLRLGLYAHDSHDLVEIEQCHIHCPLGERAYQKVREILKASSLAAYTRRDSKIGNFANPGDLEDGDAGAGKKPIFGLRCVHNRDTGEGELRHLLIKTAAATEQVLVILVTNGEGSKELLSVAQKIVQSMPEIKGVVQNINNEPDNVVLGSEFRTLAGQGFIEEILSGLAFKVSPASFFQVNPAQAEQLYRKAIEYAALTGEERVLDAYCGVGTLSLILAQRAKQVIGIECVAEAIADARVNAEKNALSNVDFVCANAEEFVIEGDIDVALLNPPRKGCERVFLEKLAARLPKRIVYISCDPATLARDLAILCDKGYSIQNVQPFDMFPQTAHVEVLVLLHLR